MDSVEMASAVTPIEILTRLRDLLAKQFHISPEQISASDTVEMLTARYAGPPRKQMTGKFHCTHIELQMIVFLIDLEDAFALTFSDEEFDAIADAKSNVTLPEIAGWVDSLRSRE